MELQQFIYVLRLMPEYLVESNWTNETNEIVGRHFESLKRLLAQGTVIMAGRTTTMDETAFGIVVFKAENQGEAERIMLSDPAVVEGVMTAELHPFRIALANMQV
ncbi:YciI family protein [Mesobacillus subterraneus]|uniref:YciI family protein n=1 Tax=Mesobacillus subterraneus TaxID=285983 RepID=UPI001CFEF8C2|nr:YciI family protein [Mesobacillus subterraneus]